MNIVDIELSVFSSQCLNRRIPDIETLRSKGKRGRRIGIRQQIASTGGLPLKTHASN
ncbi:MAG: hypothetical protein OXD49_05460 [Candidatus Poribacteria bacterium]|nr:hypothetical protein [Candidatus Poribacteria bacterium]